jgi:hypothetical protein
LITIQLGKNTLTQELLLALAQAIDSTRVEPYNVNLQLTDNWD